MENNGQADLLSSLTDADEIVDTWGYVDHPSVLLATEKDDGHK